MMQLLQAVEADQVKWKDKYHLCTGSTVSYGEELVQIDTK